MTAIEYRLMVCGGHRYGYNLNQDVGITLKIPSEMEVAPHFKNLTLFSLVLLFTDMEFVHKFTPLDFQVKNFTPSILPNFNSFSKNKTQIMSENGEIYTAGKNFTLPPALTEWTNSTSDFLRVGSASAYHSKEL